MTSPRVTLGAAVLLLFSCATGADEDGPTVIECGEDRLANCASGCADLEADINNCGVCGNACDGGHICEGGACTLVCPPEQLECAGICTDIQNDDRNCGECDRSCGPGELCRSGNCIGSGCPQGYVVCDDVCTNPLTDNQYCGARNACEGGDVGRVCDDGTVCDGTGKCNISCAGIYVRCDDRCINPLTSSKFCGATGSCTDDEAGEECGPGEKCDGNGVCAVSCASPLVECAGSCIDPMTDPAYCGAAGDCTGGNAGAACNVDQACVLGACEGLE